MYHEPGAPYELDSREGDDDRRTLALPGDADSTALGAGLRRTFGDGRWRLPAILFALSLLVFGAFAHGRGALPSTVDTAVFGAVAGYFGAGLGLLGLYDFRGPDSPLPFRPAVGLYFAVGIAGAGYGLVALPETGTLPYVILGYLGLGAVVTALHLADAGPTPSVSALLGFVVVGSVVFGGFSIDRVTDTSRHTHFVYQADTLNTMLAAQWSDEASSRREGKNSFELQKNPPHNNDWASWWELELEGDEKTYRGIWLGDRGSGRFKSLEGEVYYIESNQIDASTRRYFVSFPPAPAVALMPFAAVWGYDVNDVLFTVFFAAFNVLLMFLVLRRLSRGGRSGRSRRDNLWLTALFALGTAHLWCSVLGEVWFTALVFGVTCTLAYLLFAMDARHPVLAGIALAVGFATRTPLVFASVFFFAFVLLPGGRWRTGDWGRAARKLVLFCLPCLAVGCSLLWMNEVRFGQLTHFGHRYLAGGSLDRIQTYGLFNFHFFSKNLSALLTLIPRFQPDPPYVIISKHGMSLFMTTPAFLYLFLPEERDLGVDAFWWRLLWITVAAVGIPALFYQNTGFEQFGYRFVMDYLPLLIVLLAVGRRPLSWLFKACVVAGFAVNGFGAVTFKRAGKFYRDGFFL
jgi:hypothetical protein